jgi:hypothetical protein
MRNEWQLMWITGGMHCEDPFEFMFVLTAFHPADYNTNYVALTPHIADHIIDFSWWLD